MLSERVGRNQSQSMLRAKTKMGRTKIRIKTQIMM